MNRRPTWPETLYLSNACGIPIAKKYLATRPEFHGASEKDSCPLRCSEARENNTGQSNQNDNFENNQKPNCMLGILSFLFLL